MAKKSVTNHYELQSYENPLKMSLKNQESIFQGTEYGDFIFMVYFACHEFSIKRQWWIFMAHEIAMKYRQMVSWPLKKLGCYRFHGPWTFQSWISEVMKNEPIVNVDFMGHENPMKCMSCWISWAMKTIYIYFSAMEILRNQWMDSNSINLEPKY